jgi:elongation factor G
MPDQINTQPLLVERAIEAKSKVDQQKLELALARLATEDASFRWSIDRESGQIILKGTSEACLEGKVDALKRSGIAFNIGAPQVAFLERVTARVEHSYTHKKQTGRTGQFAAVTLVVEPNEPGKGYTFESKIAGNALRKDHVAGVEKGIESVLSSGVVAGFPVVDVRVQLVDGKYHDVDSTTLAFEIAARAAFREALQKGKSVLLEPIMKVEVMTPGEYAKAVIDDLRRRRGEDIGFAATIKAMVPLITMFGYGNALRTIAQGQATFTMRFGHYAPAPPSPEHDPFRPAIGMRA